MPATTDDLAPPSQILYVRIPAHLKHQLEALAARDNNTVSAMARRLLSKALRAEPKADRHG